MCSFIIFVNFYIEMEPIQYMKWNVYLNTSDNFRFHLYIIKDNEYSIKRLHGSN